MKKGFTLAELMIVLLIMGVVASLTIPTLLKNVSSNNNRILFKSAYKLVETTVNDEISDISLYPTGTFDSTFCTNFFSNLNTIGTVNCAASTLPTASTEGTPNATTSNGMRWYGFNTALAQTAFAINDTTPLTVSVDIDGLKGKHTPNIDVFQINVFRTGKVNVTGTTETNYLSN